MTSNRFTVTKEHIDELKRCYRNSGYSLDEYAPDWLEQLGNASERDLGILALVGPVGVNIGRTRGKGDRLWPDAPSIFLAGLAGKVRSGRKHISLGIPPLARDLPLFLASTSILSKVFAEDSSLTSTSAKGVLIVSPDISLRSKYCDLYVDREHIESAFPGSRMLFTGKIQPLSNNVLHGAVSGVCFFLPHRRDLPQKVSISPELIILDLRYSRLVTKSEDLISWAVSLRTKAGILALYTCGDRLSATTLRKAGFKDFPFDHVGIQVCGNHNHLESSDSSTASLNLALLSAPELLTRRHVVEEVQAPRETKKTISELTALLEEHREDNHLELNRIRWLFSIYCQMPVPLLWYENAARDRGRWVPKHVIARIGANSREIGKLGPVLQTFRALLLHLDHLYEEASPKADRIAKYTLSLSGDLSSEKRLLILVRDEVMQNALSSWLSLSEFFGKKWLEYVDIVSSSNYLKYLGNEYHYFISPGSLHYRYRWILGGPLGPHLQFFAYPHEIAIIRSQILQFYDRKYLDHRARRRVETIADLIGRAAPTNMNEEIAYPDLDLVMPDTAPVQHQTQKKALQKVESFEDLMTVVQERAEKTEQEQEELNVSSDMTFENVPEKESQEYSISDVESILRDVDGVPCHEIELFSQDRGLGTMWVANDRFVEFVRPDSPEDLNRLTPDHLLEKDLLLIVDQHHQQGIFERLVEISDNNPRMKYIASYRNVWRKAIILLEAKFRDVATGRVDYSRMHKELISEDIEITSLQTLQNWLNDVVIGPADLSSIVAVGKVASVVELWKRPKEFDKNFARIRSLHRSIGRRVAQVIRQTFKAAVSAESLPADKLEDSVGIPLEEIIHSIDICEVRSVTRCTANINPDLVGMFVAEK